MSLKKWLALVVALAPFSAYASPSAGENTNPIPPFLNITAPNQLDGVSINPNISAPGNFSTLNTAATTTQGTVFSPVLTGNPLSLMSASNVTVASANATGGISILTGVGGRTIYPISVNMEGLGGSTATCTGAKIVCTTSLRLAGTFVAANLASGLPTGLFTASNIPGDANGRGCVAGDGLVVSTYGSACTAATSFNVLVSYTVQ